MFCEKIGGWSEGRDLNACCSGKGKQNSVCAGAVTVGWQPVCPQPCLRAVGWLLPAVSSTCSSVCGNVN